jgi:hypothetical protein
MDLITAVKSFIEEAPGEKIYWVATFFVVEAFSTFGFIFLN